MKLEHKFVTNIPQEIEDGAVYISMEYGTAIHNCCCGCGNQVVTPFSPAEWQLSFDGESVSLYPSIGNWSFPCRSHYWIKNNKVRWASTWNDRQIEEVKEKDRTDKMKYSKNKHKRSFLDFFK